jgi:hypothetical protein
MPTKFQRSMPVLKHRMTNRELCHWLGNGEIKICNVVYTAYHYPVEQANQPVPHGILIRKWGSEVWEEPYIEGAAFEGHKV